MNSLSLRLRAGPVLLAVLLACGGCESRAPVSDYPRVISHAIPAEETAHTDIGKAVSRQEKAHPGASGFRLMPGGSDAFLARVALVEAAQRSIDLQYFSTRDDRTGKLLLQALLRAADRGVRVRMLLDDWNLDDFKAGVEALNAHPNIEIRVFNPYSTENQSLLSRAGNIFTRFAQFTRRMHNKALIADNQMAVMGGRNLGDEYFGASADFNFRDMDVVTAGPIVSRISDNFDRYWNSQESYPVAALNLPVPDAVKTEEVKGELLAHWQEVGGSPAGAFMHQPILALQIEKGKVPLVWAPAEMVADDPRKIEQAPEQTVSKPELKMNVAAGNAQHEFIIITPYFVPLGSGTEWLSSLARRGIRVRVLTNSLASTDMIVVHAAYSRYRKDLLEGGIEIHELKPIGGVSPHHMFKGSSQSSLHAKIYIIDRRDLFVGSFNMDPRSIQYNTEQVLVIHSPELAAQAADIFERTIQPSTSYHVVLASQQRIADPRRASSSFGAADSGVHLVWKTQEDDREVEYDSEPGATAGRRFMSGLFTILPDKSL